jgi:hypothetical protein
MRRTGCPVDLDQWEWGCGFYPGMEPVRACAVRRSTSTTRASTSKRLGGSFQEWRDQHDGTARRDAMCGERLPSISEEFDQCDQRMPRLLNSIEHNRSNLDLSLSTVRPQASSES